MHVLYYIAFMCVFFFFYLFLVPCYFSECLCFVSLFTWHVVHNRIMLGPMESMIETDN